MIPRLAWRSEVLMVKWCASFQIIMHYINPIVHSRVTRIQQEHGDTGHWQLETTSQALLCPLLVHFTPCMCQNPVRTCRWQCLCTDIRCQWGCKRLHYSINTHVCNNKIYFSFSIYKALVKRAKNITVKDKILNSETNVTQNSEKDKQRWSQTLKDV